VGAGEAWGWLQREVSRRGLKDHVLLLGHRDDIPEVLEAMDVFLLTSAWEGLPSALVEAAAAGVPIVTTAVSGVRDVVEHEASALVFQVGDTAGLAAGAIRLLSEPNSAATLAAHARRSLPRGFEPSVVVNEHARLYRDLGLLPDREECHTEAAMRAENVGAT
jgi:glycosyltransferase involved in cell wall biosynthesis